MPTETYLEHLCELNVDQKPVLRPKTGIICTIGPACATVEKIEKLVQKGMKIARMNFSHGSYEYHRENIKKVREVESRFIEDGRTIAVALDTQGPEIRTGLLTSGPTGEVKLKKDAYVILTTDPKFKTACTAEKLYVTYDDIHKVLVPGAKVYIDDGLISLNVQSITDKDILCKVENEGSLGSRKGINLPGTKVTLPAVTEKDIADLKFGVENEVDIIFASFTRNAEGVKEMRKVLGEKGKNIKIIAKIESQEGVHNIKEIIAEADGIMVARGDLGIEIPPEKVFIAQKMIIASCNLVGKPAICATQMLESMITKPRPTRAEGSDVANAVLDGADCVMLSGETAKGSYPVEAVSIMNDICREAECAVYYMKFYEDVLSLTPKPTSMEHTIAIAASSAATMCGAKAIICITSAGKTAALISRYRPPVPIFAVCRHKSAARQMNLWRGVFSLFYTKAKIVENRVQELDERVNYGIEVAKKENFVKTGDRLVLVTSPLVRQLKGSGHTNTLRIVNAE